MDSLYWRQCKHISAQPLEVHPKMWCCSKTAERLCGIIYAKLFSQTCVCKKKEATWTSPWPDSVPSRPPTCAEPRCRGTLVWSRAGSSGGRRAAGGRPPPVWSGAGGSGAAWDAAAPAGTSGVRGGKSTHCLNKAKISYTYFHILWLELRLSRLHVTERTQMFYPLRIN